MTVMTVLPRMSRIRRYLIAVSAALLLSVCAGVSAWFAQPVAAQTAAKDLSCTYYDDKDRGSPGTCGVDKRDKTKYRCYSNQDPSKSNPQVACEWKVQRAAGATK